MFPIPITERNPPNHCCEHKLQVSEITDDRSHHTCKCMRSGSACKQAFIEFVKLSLRDLLVVKYFYNTLSVHPLFHKSCDISKVKLLTDEILSTVSRDYL